MSPITVIGAGPAGLACAIALARAGRRVVLRERCNRVGQRFHDDFQGLENWSDAADVLEELRAAGIEASFEHHPVCRLTGFDPRGERYRIESAQPLYYLVRRGASRGALDSALLEQALALGVEVRFGECVRTAEGAAVLAAGPRLADVIATGYVFETDGPDGNWIALGNRLAPLGYAYLLVHGGAGTVACCLFKEFKVHARYLERTVAFFRDQAGLAMRNPRPFGGYGTFRVPRATVQGGHPLVGEHAGFQDALAGFGMRYAMRSGLLAARGLVEGSDYSALCAGELLPLQRASIVNRFLLAAAGEPAWRLLMRRLARGDARAFLRRLYSPSLAHRVLFPLAGLRYHASANDACCNHVDCDCVWCQCEG